MMEDNQGDVEILPQREDEDTSSELAVPSHILPSTVHLLPISERPFFPAQALPVLMNEDPWLETLTQVNDTAHKTAGVVLVKADQGDETQPEDFYEVGTLVRVHDPARNSGKVQFMAEGVQRFRIKRWVSRRPPYIVQVEYPKETTEASAEEIRAYAMAIINIIKELLPLNPLYSEELKFFLNRFGPNEPSALTDFAASLTTADKEDLQEVLEGFDLHARMQKVLVLIKKELEVAKLQSHIREQVEEEITEQQRKFFLREQLKIIQKELGISKDDRTADVERFRGRLEGLILPATAEEQINDELDKLSVLEVGSPEYGVTRNYLDWVTSLPWGIYSEDQLDLTRARKILDDDHDGLEDVKNRILEFLAVGAMRGEVTGSILLLVGPPGVGKTSLGRSVARTLGREFYRLSLGGIRDEAEIKGHRRTYIGAMPGKFIQAIKEAGTANPVIMLDEIDKIGASFQGDPASALLEVLDPEQNSDFLDHYLDTRFDLSKVLFIATGNQLDTIPTPLLDRMEVIRLSGYIAEEKVQIARHHLWPQQVARGGLKSSQLKLTDAALRHLIDNYAREAGVRNLEKQLARVVRKTAVQLVSGKERRINITKKTLETYLGPSWYQRQRPLTGIGVATGLAWTPLGGATLNIEASRVHTTNRGFRLTGSLGEVMRESAEIAYSYIAANLRPFKGDQAFFDTAYVHLHVPEGATPKDGPSAGVTMATALLSLARNQKLSRPLAMTGELTLTGQVLAVGGIREKVIAARRSKLNEIILPEPNRTDFSELPEHLQAGLTVHFIKHYRELVPLAFAE